MTDDKQDETVNKIKQITAQPKTIEVGGVEFEIYPLSNKEFLSHIANSNARNAQDVDQEQVTIDIVTTILQKDDSDITKQDVKEAPMELTIKVMEAIEQVNGLEDFFEKAEKQMQNQQR